MWFKVDDKLHVNRKTRRVLNSHDGKRLDAAPMGLWVIAGAWAGQNSAEDGWVPEYELDRWDDDWPALVARLVAADLWWPEERDGEPGYSFVNWEEYKPGAGASADGKYGNHVKWHVKRGRVSLTCDLCPKEPEDEPDLGAISGPETSDLSGRSRGDDRGEIGSPIGSIAKPDPNPTRSEAKDSLSTNADASETEEIREDVDSLCQHLASRIADNGNKAPTITKAWRTQARLLIDRDGRTLEDAHRLIDWCQDDTFWMSNILSMPKFREKYDQLRLKAGLAVAGPVAKAVDPFLDEHGRYRDIPAHPVNPERWEDETA